MKYSSSEEEVFQIAKKIKLLILDVDGVLTDGKLYFSENGEEIKAFNSLDGHGIKMLRSAGIEVGIITGRNTNLLKKRAADLGIKYLFQGREDKLNALDELMSQTRFTCDQIAYAGDDFPDLPVMKCVALPLAVANSHPELKRIAKAETGLAGGSGAVREICELILKAQGLYQQFLA